MEYQLSIPEWLKLPHAVRVRMVEIFNIPKSQGVIMMQTAHGAELSSDGHTYKDLAVLTVKTMNEYLGTGKDEIAVGHFPHLFDAVVKKVGEELAAEKPEPIQPPIEETLLQYWASALVGIKEKAVGAGLLPHLEEVVKRVFELNKPLSVKDATNTNVTPKKRGRKKAQ